ncbi:E3.1.1.45 [Mytilus edulis]|uniref:E3.1.1.45 n=1 Tax=Mytilus edulis TaxID=6550 RepID=A0A8S3TBD4_MYTED|nr:E3.1.1.45 [Mytilus edulis]
MQTDAYRQACDKKLEVKIEGDIEAAKSMKSTPELFADVDGTCLQLNFITWPTAEIVTVVGVTGFCMGGALTLASAALVPEVDAAAPFYGIPGKALCDLKNIKCPVQCHFGNLDTLEGFSAPKDQDLLEQTLKETGVVFEFYRYEANHAFTNTTGPNYNKECCDLALKRYKNDNSYRLHSNGHIRDVRQSKFHSDIHYVKAACVPEERQSADPCEVWIVVLFDGNIHSAECTCVAGDGTCKHVAALLFGMQRFCQDLSDRSVISVTDKAAKWVNPVRTSAQQ